MALKRTADCGLPINMEFDEYDLSVQCWTCLVHGLDEPDLRVVNDDTVRLLHHASDEIERTLRDIGGGRLLLKEQEVAYNAVSGLPRRVSTRVVAAHCLRASGYDSNDRDIQ